MTNQIAANASPRMMFLYEGFAESWGEPDHLIAFDPEEAQGSDSLQRLQVAVWRADERCDVTSFVTLGMSDLQMQGQLPYAELQFAVRGALSDEDIHQGAQFLANMAAFPFHNHISLDWWSRISQAGAVPLFPESSGILFRPPFDEDDPAELEHKDDTIRLLVLVPMTAEENAILSEDGIDAYEDYMIENGLDPLGHR